MDTYFWFPPGAGEHTIASEYLQVLDARMAPFMSGERQPALKNYYLLNWAGGGTMGARVLEEGRLKELEKIIDEEIFADLPDLRHYTSQGNLF